MPGAPVALDKPPGSGNINCVPGVPEPVVLKLDSGLVAGRLGVALDDHTVKTSVTENILVIVNDVIEEKNLQLHLSSELEQVGSLSKWQEADNVDK